MNRSNTGASTPLTWIRERTIIIRNGSRVMMRIVNIQAVIICMLDDGSDDLPRHAA